MIEKNLELDASTLPQGITLHSPVGGYRKLSIGPSAVVSVKRITFTAEALASSMGPKQGGAIYNEGSLTLQECRFVKNGGGGNGGAICTVGGLTMERCVFEGNETRGIGGAVYMKRPVALVRVVHCLFKGNVSHGNGGGAIHVASRGTDTQVVLEHCTLTENSATSSQNRDMTMVPADRGAGGGIRVEPGPVEITHCIIAGNKAVMPGMEDVRGEVKQTGPNFIGGDPKDAPAGLGASVK
ncbi:MAG: right-handed parallel beta-helix repeat-containing protein [Verrucomicrobiaceae bacterium]|nr:right-handed parallel beta-helix repeat-containing protein [Verrucomicrobiaceae bacterium]